MITLSFLVSPRVLGEYVVAMAVGALPLIVPSAVSFVLYPLFSRQPRAESGRPLARFMLLAILMTLAGVPAVLLLSPLVVTVFFGSTFSAAVAIGQILGVASLMRGMSVMTTSVLRGLGAPIRASSGDVAGLLVMATVLVPAVHLAGGEGAAVAVLFGTVTAATWMAYHAMRVVGLSPLELVRWWGVELGRRQAGPSDLK
jgi:O-antigen/teichoic acid export membrane protein